VLIGAIIMLINIVSTIRRSESVQTANA